MLNYILAISISRNTTLLRDDMIREFLYDYTFIETDISYNFIRDDYIDSNLQLESELKEISFIATGYGIILTVVIFEDINKITLITINKGNKIDHRFVSDINNLNYSEKEIINLVCKRSSELQ